MEVSIIKDQTLHADLVDQIIEFDKRNMKPILEEAGIEFPEDRRRKGFQNNPTLIIAFDAQTITGYLEYVRSWNDPNYIYIASLQIGERYRNSRVLLQLLTEFRSLTLKEDFQGFETNVQKVNSAAVNLCQKAGFRFEQNPNNEASWLAVAGRDFLQTSRLGTLLDRWAQTTHHTRQPSKKPDGDDNS